NIIGKAVSGIADDLLSSIIMVAGARTVFAPAMNVRMLENPFVSANIARLRSLGYGFVEPETGFLACGEEARGRLAPVEKIIEEVERFLGEKQLFSGVRVLVTAGRTEEPIDDVRYVSNRSSGKMGFALASAARDMGADVTLVSGCVSVEPPSGVNLVPVRTASEMRTAVVQEARKAEVVVMAAAVSDFTPARIERGKIPRESRTLALSLTKTHDILAEVGRAKGGKLLVGFAVEVENETERAKEKLRRKNLDLVVVNNPLQWGAGFDHDTNVVTMIDRRGTVEALPLMSKYEVAAHVLKKAASLRKRS
ncbi:MAG: bifunctional phosphopantothenoylcysteine decarboxylase/phosphopantothenate--cysteine ligase CoaBC, partial [Candidatus Eisenbacteria bacterium]